MLRYFFKSKPDRFSQKIASKEILPLLKELTDKERYVKEQLFTLGLEQDLYVVYLLIDGLVSNLNNSIDAFNAKPIATDQFKETEETLALLRELNDYIEQTKALKPGWHEASRIIDRLSEALKSTIAIYLKKLDGNAIHSTTEDLIQRPSPPQ